MKKSPEKKEPGGLRVPPEDAGQVRQAGAEVEAAQMKLELAQLRQRVALLEAVLKVKGFDLAGYTARFAGDGSLELTPRG